ncbi:MAG: hypothetical protein HFH87_00880 [Lachnospiraceae bacterium]|nr:hypothetical protein [Lachnospiraceae bacterium]
MISLIRKNISLWGYGKALALFAGCLLFSLSSRYGNDLSFEQYIVSAVSDHYYLTYFLIPLVLLSCFSFLEDDSGQTVLRFGSYYAYFWKKWLGTGLIAMVMVTIQTVLILISGIGLNVKNNWLLYQNMVNAELFGELQQWFSNPLVAFIIITIYQLLGIWFVFGLCIWIGHFIGRKLSVKILVTLYILSALWIKIPALQRIPVTGLNHLIILHHNLTSPWRFAVTGITAISLCIFMLLSLRFKRRMKILQYQKKWQGIAAYYQKALITKHHFIIMCAVVLGIVLYKGLGNAYLMTSEEWIYILFYGHGTGYFQVLPFLELLIVNIVPLYLLAIFVEHIISGQSMFISIRTKGRKEVLSGILTVSVIFLILYVFLWLAGGVLGSIFFGYGFNKAAGMMLLYAAGLKFLDILFQYLVMIGVYFLTKQITMGFLILVVGNMLCFMPAHWIKYLPFGLSSMARIQLLDLETGVSVYVAALIMTALSLGLLLLLKSFGYRKLLG